MIAKQFTFEAAHILNLPYPSKCNRLHGHSYTVTIFVDQPLNHDGMEHDYTDFPKDCITALDHKLLVSSEQISNLGPRTRVVSHQTELLIPSEDCYIIDGENTTAELIARHLFNRIRQTGFPVIAIKVSETQKTEALYDERYGNL